MMKKTHILLVAFLTATVFGSASFAAESLEEIQRKNAMLKQQVALQEEGQALQQKLNQTAVHAAQEPTTDKQIDNAQAGAKVKEETQKVKEQIKGAARGIGIKL